MEGFADADRGFLRSFATICAVATGVGLVAVTVYYVFPLLLMVVLGCVLAELLLTMSSALAHVLPGPRWLHVVLSLVLLLGLGVGLVIAFIIPLEAQSADLVEQVPRRLAWISQLQSRVSASAAGQTARSASQPLVTKALSSLATSGVPALVTGVGGALDVLGIVFFSLFVALSPEAHRAGFVSMWPRDMQPNASLFLDETRRALRAWLGALAASMAIVGFATTLGLFLLGVPYWLVFGLLAAGVEIVPYGGAVLGFIGPGAVCLIMGDVRKAVFVFLLYLVLQLLLVNLVKPFFMKRRSGVPASLAIFSILGLGLVEGILGIVAAVPLAAIVFVALKTLSRARIDLVRAT